jgi:hypothetical protein
MEAVMLNAETTVREIALQVPESTRVFERLKIDYCCGGNQPLAKACASAGIDVDNVMGMLAEVTESISPSEAGPDFQSISLPELIAHVVETHHVFTKAEMDRLEALGDKVLAAHGGNHPELVRVRELRRYSENSSGKNRPRILSRAGMAGTLSSGGSSEAETTPSRKAFSTTARRARSLRFSYDPWTINGW